MSKFTTSLSGAASLGALRPEFDGFDPLFDELEEIEAYAEVSDAEVAAVAAECDLLSAIDRFARAQAQVLQLRVNAETAS